MASTVHAIMDFILFARRACGGLHIYRVFHSTAGGRNIREPPAIEVLRVVIPDPRRSLRVYTTQKGITTILIRSENELRFLSDISWKFSTRIRGIRSKSMQRVLTSTYLSDVPDASRLCKHPVDLCLDDLVGRSPRAVCCRIQLRFRC